MPDRANTVEVIRIPHDGLPAVPFALEVRAAAMAGQAVPGLDGGQFNQDFALYVYNAEVAP